MTHSRRAAADDARDRARRGAQSAWAIGQDDRRADAAADADGVAGLDQLGRLAERPGDVAGSASPTLERARGRSVLSPIGLDHQRDRAGIGVGVGDRQRDPLGARTLPDDDELAGSPDLRDPWRLDDEADDVRGELLALDDGMHATSMCCQGVDADRGALIVAQRVASALPAVGPVRQSEGHVERAVRRLERAEQTRGQSVRRLYRRCGTPFGFPRQMFLVRELHAGPDWT